MVLCYYAGDYKEVLRKYIDPEQLPAAYGGTRCEPDPSCTKYVSTKCFSVCVCVCVFACLCESVGVRE